MKPTIQKLTQISPSYNSFVPDQVLTHTQLNGIIDFFEDQNRMTRLRLSGSGIACGFQLSVVGTNLSLSQGTGITTDGDLIYNTFIDEDGTTIKSNCESIEFTNFINYNDEPTEYFESLIDGYEDGQILELLTDKATENLSDSISYQNIDLTNFPNGEGSINDYVFFIYLESFDKETGACTSTSCENQGNERTATMRYLMVPTAYAQVIIDDYDTHYREKKSYEALQDGLKKLQVKRLIFHSGTNVLSANSASEVASYYFNAIQDGTTLTDLKVGFNSMCDKMGISDYFETEINTALNFASGAIPSDVQYRFDLFKDLIETYNEARDLLMHIDTYCCPDIHAFPKHLMVNGFNLSGSNVEFTTTYRHSFYESPVVGHERTNYLNVLALLERARSLAAEYAISGEAVTTIITPSNLDGTLGSKAIPFYYSRTQGFLDAWDYEKTSARIQDTHLSYNKALLSSQSAIQDPLAYTIDENNFYRIEGHHGKAPQDVKNDLEEQIRMYGLDFEVVIADVSGTDPNLSTLVEKRPSITHFAGVPKGGTFILASENNTIFADFAIAGKIPAENKGVGCCPLVECSYPYISSLKYLNNLSRSLNGTQSSSITMPMEYKLLITRYEINGQSIKTSLGPELVTVLLTDIFLGRTHAIMRALNAKYPRGVVFDYNESQKRMTITRSKYDKYVIEMQDITLSSLGLAPFQPVYTYSNTGMFCASSSPRKGLSGTHRPFVMVCRELREYNEAFYESLQGRIAPLNKDDDYTEYRKDWEQFIALKWKLPQNPVINQLGLRRFINAQTQLSYSRQVLLFQMMNDMQGALFSTTPAAGAEQSRALSFVLDGDWVTGEYVSSGMFALWTKINDTQIVKDEYEQEVFNFVELKKHLHEDRGVTKMSIYITGAQYSSIFDPVIENYDDSFDFYFSCAPRGEYAIQLSTAPPTDPGTGGGGDTGGGIDFDIGVDVDGTRLPNYTDPIYDGIKGDDVFIPEYYRADYVDPSLDPWINPGDPVYTSDPYIATTGPGPIYDPATGGPIVDENIITTTGMENVAVGTTSIPSTENVVGSTSFEATSVNPELTGTNVNLDETAMPSTENIVGTSSFEATSVNPELTGTNVNLDGTAMPSTETIVGSTSIEATAPNINPEISGSNLNITGARAMPENEDISMENMDVTSTNLNPEISGANLNITTSRAIPLEENMTSTNIEGMRSSEPIEVKSTNIENPIVGTTGMTSANLSVEPTAIPVTRASRMTAEPVKTAAVKSTASPIPEPKSTKTKEAKTRATKPKAANEKNVATKKASVTKRATAKKTTATKKAVVGKSTAKKATAKKASSVKKAVTPAKATATTAAKAKRKSTAKRGTAAKARATRKRNTKK